MKKVSKRQKAYQIRRKLGIEKRRVNARDRHKQLTVQQITGA